MTSSPDLERRVSALESRIEIVAADAAAARHLAAANDRDLADIGVKVDANRKAINALGVQTAGRFDRVDKRLDGIDTRLDGMDQRFDGMDQRFDRLERRVEDGFAAADRHFGEIDRRFEGVDRRLDGLDRGMTGVRGTLDQFAGVQQRVVDMLTTLIERDTGE